MERAWRSILLSGLALLLAVSLTGCPSVPKTSLFLEKLSVTSPVNPGNYATLTAKTLPYADCEITVYYKSGPSTAQGLEDKKADSSGNVSWTWKVGTRTTAGSWHIVVTVSLGGEEVSDTTYIRVL